MEHPTIEETLAFIKEAHAGQMDKGGHPYWEHPVNVMHGLPIGASDDEKHAALLHDVVEDTSYTLEDLKRRGYSPQVLEIVRLLTKDKGSMITYMDYIRALAATGNKGAIRVKIADNEHNSSEKRIAQLPSEKQGIVHKYQRSLKILRKAL